MPLVYNKSNSKIEEAYDHKYHIVEPGGIGWLPNKIYLRFLRLGKIEPIDNLQKTMKDHPDLKFKYLIIRDGGLGDLILLEPALRKIKEKFEGCELTLACDKHNIDLCKGFECVDIVKDIKEVNTSDYQYYNDLRAYSETNKLRIDHHRTDVYLNGLEIDYNIIPAADKMPRVNILKSKLQGIPNNKHLIVIQCGTSHSYRDYPHTEKLINKLANSNKYYIILIDYKYHFAKVSHPNVLDLRCVTTMAAMLNIISQADIMISPDSGGMHVALSQNIPTISLFGIIYPKYRTRYYPNDKSIEFFKESCNTPGCGTRAMNTCKKSNSQAAKCMLDITPEEIIKAVEDLSESLQAGGNLYSGKPQVKIEKTKPADPIIDKGLTLVCICQDEEQNIPQFIKNVMGNKYVSRTVVIDGGSKDNSVKLLREAGAEVYEHPYLKDYHDMQAVQRNISFTYVRAGERCLIMDFDECFSPELADNLSYLLYTSDKFIQIPRRTFNTYSDAMRRVNQIKDYPDYQPRFFIWDHKYKWIRSPHHCIVNAPMPSSMSWDILHFEREKKNREAIEQQWQVMQERTLKYYG